MNAISAAKTRWLSGGRAELNGLGQSHFSTESSGNRRAQSFKPGTALRSPQDGGASDTATDAFAVGVESSGPE